MKLFEACVKANLCRNECKNIFLCIYMVYVVCV